jgi:hypothetical protein
MNAPHTPGPWSSEHRKKHNGMWDTEVFCAKGDTIATIAWYPMPTVDGVTGTYREGNARLIAAAPDLLRELQHAVHWFDQLTPEDVARYRAVIAKATGEQA